jgi:D-glycero-alpha-D-manno-heptose 1-phosphate guanylyltransferase
MTETACIVLAGGLGTRLGQTLGTLPKCLAPVGNRAFLDLQLDALSKAGVSHFVLSLGHAAEAVLAHLPSLQNRFTVQAVIEPQRLGTGGAILFAMAECGLDECLVANGDTFLDGMLTLMLRPLDRDGGELLRLATVEVENRGRFGGLALDESRVLRFLEKGFDAPGPINAGFYRVTRAAFGDRTPGTTFSFEEDVMPDLVSAGVMHAVAIGGSFMDIGVPEDYRRFCSRYGSVS